MLVGCTTVVVGAGGGKTSHHFGYVRLEEPKTAGTVVARGVDTVGIAVKEGIFLGWHSSDKIASDPSSCVLMVVINNKGELDQAMNVLERLERKDLCAASFGSQ